MCIQKNGLVYNYGLIGGNISNRTIHDSWDGFFSNSGQNITIEGSNFIDNLRYGINPHSQSHGLNIIGNTVKNNSLAGILLSDGGFDIRIINNSVSDNYLSGIRITSDTINTMVEGNHIFDEDLAISVESSSNNTIKNNIIDSSNQGILLIGPSKGNSIWNNTLDE